MKKISLAYAILTTVLLSASVAIAQANPPGGSYRQSCYGISFNGRTLTATCLTRNGTPVTTSLPFANRCHRDIANINGTLTCR